MRGSFTTCLTFLGIATPPWCRPTFFKLCRNYRPYFFDTFVRMRKRRMLRSKKMYDLCFRSLQGLPLPARALTALLIESIMGRLLRAEDVIVCSYVWMSNHVHMQLFSLDCEALTHFHERLKKRLTDFLKRLLNLSHLRLWDNRTTLAEVLDLEAAIERIVYTYLNPVRAGLVRSIDDYRGCNTWREFLSAPAYINTIVEKEVPWILATDIRPMSQKNPSLSEERGLIRSLHENASRRKTHKVKIMPFKWLQAFNIVDSVRIEEIRQRIISRVRAEEAKLSLKREPLRKLEGFVVTDTYVPRKKERKVFMYGSTKETRWTFLAMYRSFVSECVKCYELMRLGVTSIPWPPECFRPPGPRLCNAL